MTNIFSPQEILRIAIRVEENGRVLYESLKVRTRNARLQEMWHYLAEQEALHRQVFKNMLDNVGDYIVNEFNPGEYQTYIRAMAREYVFTQELIEQKTKEGFDNDSQALDFAITIEKDSILTYTALRDYVLAERQAVIEKVIEEEKKHLVQLVLLKEDVE